ncbi:hypothetical protein GC169_12495 [bacterium]|nr:hypothetical protein [bacterium]
MASVQRIAVPMRLRIETPVAGVAYSLQDKSGEAIQAQVASGDTPLVFEFASEASIPDGKPAPRFFGAFIRSEGKERQFVYVAVGQVAGQAASCWTRRMKIDIHSIAADDVHLLGSGRVLEATVSGTGPDGTPACATVRPTRDWRRTDR